MIVRRYGGYRGFGDYRSFGDYRGFGLTGSDLAALMQQAQLTGTAPVAYQTPRVSIPTPLFVDTTGTDPAELALATGLTHDDQNPDQILIDTTKVAPMRFDFETIMDTLARATQSYVAPYFILGGGALALIFGVRRLLK